MSRPYLSLAPRFPRAFNAPTPLLRRAVSRDPFTGEMTSLPDINVSPVLRDSVSHVRPSEETVTASVDSPCLMILLATLRSKLSRSSLTRTRAPLRRATSLSSAGPLPTTCSPSLGTVRRSVIEQERRRDEDERTRGEESEG